jgi:hypothetical protein
VPTSAISSFAASTIPQFGCIAVVTGCELLASSGLSMFLLPQLPMVSWPLGVLAAEHWADTEEEHRELELQDDDEPISCRGVQQLPVPSTGKTAAAAISLVPLLPLIS